MYKPAQTAWLGATLLLAPATGVPSPAVAAEAEVQRSETAGALLVSFREIWPEFAEQDPTPLVRIYGDGRVVVHQPAYMKRRGVYEMWLPKPELEALLLELTPVLLAFDEKEVATRKEEAKARLRSLAGERGGPTLFYIADAEVSVFHLGVDSYRPAGAGSAVKLSSMERVWRGLRYDAERYPEVAPIQALMRAETALRALAEHDDLLWVAPVEP